MRPFSAHRSGLVLGEGAGILILEARDQAIVRGAEILAEIVGYGASADAVDMVHPSDEGAALAMSRALGDAGIDPTVIDYVSAHGSGTVINDTMETRAIRRVFGEHAHARDLVDQEHARPRPRRLERARGDRHHPGDADRNHSADPISVPTLNAISIT